MDMCEICEGTGWVCENCGTRWQLMNRETCCGAGQNCVCNPNGDVDWKVVYATTEPEEVKEWAH